MKVLNLDWTKFFKEISRMLKRLLSGPCNCPPAWAAPGAGGFWMETDRIQQRLLISWFFF